MGLQGLQRTIIRRSPLSGDAVFYSLLLAVPHVKLVDIHAVQTLTINDTSTIMHPDPMCGTGLVADLECRLKDFSIPSEVTLESTLCKESLCDQADDDVLLADRVQRLQHWLRGNDAKLR